MLAKLGLSPEALRAQNPRLIVCSISGYEQNGPLRDKAGHDLNYLARAACLATTRDAAINTASLRCKWRIWQAALCFRPRPSLPLSCRVKEAARGHIDAAMTDAVVALQPLAMASVALPAKRQRQVKARVQAASPLAFIGCAAVIAIWRWPRSSPNSGSAFAS